MELPPGPLGPLADSLQQRFEARCAGDEGSARMWEDYKSFHKACRAEGSCLERALIWRCLSKDDCSGLGDQIRGLVLTFLVAVASRRPFFIQWSQNEHNMLDFFGTGEIDLTLPEELQEEACEVRSLFRGRRRSSGGVEEFLGQPASSCEVWHTNGAREKPPKQFMPAGAQKLVSEDWIGLQGCVWVFLFPAMPWTEEDRTNLKDLPENFAAIHVRLGDQDFGFNLQDPTDAISNEDLLSMLMCVEQQGLKNVLLVTANDHVRSKVRHEAEKLGLRLFESQGSAVHIGHGHETRQHTEAWMRRGFLSEWLAMARASFLITATGKRFHGRSGFSFSASMANLLPRNRQLNAACLPL